MHTDNPLSQLTPLQYTLLMERAKREALRLRREAIAAFWADLAGTLASALRAGARRLHAGRAAPQAGARPTPAARAC